MPIRVHELPEVYQSVSRRVSVDIIKQVMRLTGMDTQMSIYFKGDGNQSPTLLNPDLNNTNVNNIRFSQNRRLTVEVKEEPIVDELDNYDHTDAEYPRYFMDNQLEIQATINYIRTRQSITFSFQSTDRQDADRFHNEFARHTQASRNILKHEVGYIVVLPDWDMALLVHLYDLREAVAGYGDSFQEYLNKHSDNKITYFTQLDGNNGSWGIEERQVDLFGWMDDNTPPEVEKGDTGANKEIQFTYIVEYDKPISTTMHYPIMVHNQLIDKVFRPVPVVYQNHQPALKSKNQYLGDNIRQFNMWSKEVTYHRYNYSDLRVPEFDPWEANNRPRNTDDLATLLIQIDEEQPNYVLSIPDLFPLMTFSPELIRYLRLFHRFLNNPMESPIHFILYSTDREIAYDELYIDYDLKITTKRPMDLRTQYHLRMGILHDLMLMSEQCFKRLMNNPWFTDQLLSYLYPSYHPSQIRRTGSVLTPGKDIYMDYSPYLKLAYYDKYRVRFKDIWALSDLEIKQFLLSRGIKSINPKVDLEKWLKTNNENLNEILEEGWVDAYIKLSDKEREVLIGKMDKTDLVKVIRENRKGELRPEGYKTINNNWHVNFITVRSTNGEENYRQQH